MHRPVIAVLLLLASTTAVATEQPGAKEQPATSRAQVEVSLQVSGHIDVDAQGRVTGHTIDHPDKLDPGVVTLVESSIAGWRFKPVTDGGQAHPVSATMDLFIVGTPRDPQHLAVGIRSAHFVDSRKPATDVLGTGRLRPPEFPIDAWMAGMSGTVYVVVRVDRKGHVVDAVAEQVNLRELDSPNHLASWRAAFAKASLRAARRWTFVPPTTGQDADEAFWSARVPVDYLREGESIRPYGTWTAYLPGPRQKAPWTDADADDATSGPEAVPTGQVAQLGQGLQLLTPLSEAASVPASGT